MKKEIDSFIISLQLNGDLYNFLKNKSKRECTSVSYLIRKMILESMREEGEDK